tara:strand:+ start:3337 stop:4110 length:774 start_codon:yes stop_codon:yes gene_type:complete
MHIAVFSIMASTFGNHSNDVHKQYESSNEMSVKLIYLNPQKTKQPQKPNEQNIVIKEIEKKIIAEKVVDKKRNKSEQSNKGNKGVRLSAFDEMLMVAKKNIDVGPQVELARTEIEPVTYNEESPPEEDKWVAEHEVPQTESATSYEEDMIRRYEEKSKQHKQQEEEFVMDPLFFHQEELISKLKKQMRLSQRVDGKSCRLHLLISRDGMVIEANRVSGDEHLCTEAKKASVRLGKISKIDDPEVYNYLKDINLEIKF